MLSQPIIDEHVVAMVGCVSLDGIDEDGQAETSCRRGYGTLYTAVYRPADASVELVWPSARWPQSCASFHEGVRTLTFEAGTAA